MAQERGLDHNQLLRARSVFEKLGAPSDEFYQGSRKATTHQNAGTRRRESGISVMMPYQYYYHRLGATKHEDYPSHMDATAVIASDGKDPSYNVLSHFAELPESQPERSPDEESVPGISQAIWNGIDEVRLASFERFAISITREWEEYQARTKPVEKLSSHVEIIGNRGLSERLANKFPYLEIIHFCSGAAAVCDFKRGESEPDCIPVGRALGIFSITTDKSCEVTDIYPEPKGCQECPLTQAPQSKQS